MTERYLGLAPLKAEGGMFLEGAGLDVRDFAYVERRVPGITHEQWLQLVSDMGYSPLMATAEE